MRDSISPPNPSGVCLCGCGQKTAIANEPHQKKGLIKGLPVKYIPGHQSRMVQREDYQPRKPGPDYIVDPVTGCHNWQRQIGRGGYGVMNIRGSTRSAHVVYYEREHGPVPEGKELHHRCRNKPCVNPDHLEPLTRMEHHRLHFCTITQEDAKEIRRLTGIVGINKLAKRFRAGCQTIKRIQVTDSQEAN